MIIENRDEELYSKFEYFNFNGIPIRTVYKESRNPIGADTIDPRTSTLVKRASLISPTLKDPDCEEITKEEFYLLCEQRVRESGVA